MTDPKFVGVTPDEDPTVAKYKENLAERAKAAGAATRVPIPNLAQAQQQFDPRKDGARTLGEIGEAQRNMQAAVDAGGIAAMEKPAGLRPETAKGLMALQEEVKAMKAQQPEVVDTGEPEKVLTEEEKAAEEVRLREVLDEADDLDVEYLLARAAQDQIANLSQQKLIEERVKPMDLADGITTGEFKQLVVIKKGVLEVLYRTVSPMEMEHIRRLVLEMQLADERMSNLSVERFTLMQTVAALVHVNGQALPSHVDNPGTLEAKFLDDVFLRKYSIVGGYPSPMIHSLSTHAYWFDTRVRKLFTMDAIKNG